MKPRRLLDLYCGAGGCSMGFHQAGFELTGVDIHPQPRYPFHFIQADALEYVATHGPLYDCIHASPPCQHYATVTRCRGTPADHPDLLPTTITLLEEIGVPWIVENVPGSPMRCDVALCGSQFGLRVQRHRWFMLSMPLFALLPPCCHRNLLPFIHKGERAYADAMGCYWMNNREAREAIPPAYTCWIGQRLMEKICH